MVCLLQAGLASSCLYFSCVYLTVSDCVAVPSSVHVSSCVVALCRVDVMLSASTRHLSGELRHLSSEYGTPYVYTNVFVFLCG